MWIQGAKKSFQMLKKKVMAKHNLVFLDFQKIFTIECDASNIAIGAIMSQEGRPITFFSEKLNDIKRK